MDPVPATRGEGGPMACGGRRCISLRLLLDLARRSPGDRRNAPPPIPQPRDGSYRIG